MCPKKTQPADVHALSNAELCALVADHLPVCIGYVDALQRVRYANARYQQLFDKPLSAMHGRPIAEVVGRTNYVAVRDRIERALEGEPADFEQVATYPGIGERTVQISYIPDTRRDGYVMGYFVLTTDITEKAEMRRALEAQNEELRRAKAELEQLALKDPLTGIGNRRLFYLRLEHAIALARRSGQPLAILLIDLDRFKRINDRHGHAAGDAVLKTTADRLQRCCRTVDTIARLGGDEFVLLMETGVTADGARVLANRLEQQLILPVDLDDTQVSIGASIGIAMAEGRDVDAERLLGAADKAMYRIKASGGGVDLRWLGPEDAVAGKPDSQAVA
ncbi:MAG: GGDEF domain-containing protein [Alphaproteobacteria bacterium]